MATGDTPKLKQEPGSFSGGKGVLYLGDEPFGLANIIEVKKWSFKPAPKKRPCRTRRQRKKL